MAGNVHAPLKTAGRLDQESVEERTHTNVQDFTQAGSAAVTDDAPQAGPSQYDKEYEQFIFEVGAIASRGGSIQEIGDKLAKYPSLASQASTLMTEVEGQNPNLPKTYEEEKENIQETHQNIAGVLGLTAEEEEKKKKEKESGINLGDMLEGVVMSASLLASLSEFTEKKPKNLKDGQEEAITHAGRGILISGLEEVSDLGSNMSPLDAQMSHGIPAKQRSQEEGLIV